MIEEMGPKARAAARVLRGADAALRSAAIRAIARQLRARAGAILAANAEDVAKATRLIDRLRLDEARLDAIATAVAAIADLPDPLGAETARWRRPNGLDFARVRTPIGVIGMIFESRPNVAADAAAICLRSGNALILRSGADASPPASRSAKRSPRGWSKRACRRTASRSCRPPTARPSALMLAGLGGHVDLIIPRGGRSLVERVEAEARVPVLGHLEGICHATSTPRPTRRWRARSWSTPSCAASRSAARPRPC
jgi:glutamate-5-semialdehyde dehydrogenase